MELEIGYYSYVQCNVLHIVIYRYQSIQDKFSPRAETVKSELDQAISHFEQCQVYEFYLICTIIFVNSGHLCHRTFFILK